MRSTRALLAGFVVGLVTASSCGPVKAIGPTALVLEVYFSEVLGTKALLVSGTAEVDGVLVNVFPTSQRPEVLTGARFPVPQTVRVLLNDSRAGKPLQLTVIGINADGDPVEAATQTVTPMLQQETDVDVSLKPFTDTVEADGGMGRTDAGLTFDAGTRDAGVACNCRTGCCDPTGVCAGLMVPLGSRQQLPVIFAGVVGQFCTGPCPLGKTSQFLNNQCLCGTSPACGDGLRCLGTGASARCVCDAASGCRGCCSNGAVCDTPRNATCGNAGNSCVRCDGPSNLCQATGRCSASMCLPPAAMTTNRCCSGAGMVSSQWPTCPSTTGDCRACDVLRSASCRPVGVNSVGEPCACGASAQCPTDQLCLLVNNAPTCVRP